MFVDSIPNVQIGKVILEDNQSIVGEISFSEGQVARSINGLLKNIRLIESGEKIGSSGASESN